MPEIVESAKGALGKRVGPLPLGGWAAIAIGGFVVVRLLGHGKKGGSSSGSSGGTSGGFTLPDAGAGGSTGTSGGAGGVGSTGDGGASGITWPSGSQTITLPGGGTITIPGSIPIIGGSIPLPPLPGLQPPGGTTITPPPHPVPNPVTVPSKLRLTITGGTDLFSTLGKLIGHGTSGTYDATIVRLGNRSFYRILRKNAAGKLQWTLIPTSSKTVTVAHV